MQCWADMLWWQPLWVIAQVKGSVALSAPELLLQARSLLHSSSLLEAKT